MIVDAALISTIRAKIDDQFGPIPDGVDPAPIESQRQKLAVAIASGGLFVRDFGEVQAGIQVTTSSGSGQTTAPGKLS